MYKIIALSLIGLYLLFQIFLSILKYKNRNAGVPNALKDVYDEEEYKKWKAYSAEKIKNDIISTSLSLLELILIIALDVFALLAKDIANE